MTMRFFFNICLVLMGLMLASCGSTNPNHERSSAFKPAGGQGQHVMVVAPLKPVQDAMLCLQAHGVISGKLIALGPWVDSTNKGNFAANGASGGFLPGAGTTAFNIDALMSMGARVQDLTDLVTENNFRARLPDKVQQYAAQEAAKHVADFFIDGKWMTLDFSGNANLDAQVENVGPIYTNTGATVVAQLSIKMPGTSEVKASSTLRRAVFSSKFGVSFGRYVGGLLATGEATVGNQQRLQLESVEYLVMFGLVDALTKLKEGAVCRPKVLEVLGAPVSERPVVVAAK